MRWTGLHQVADFKAKVVFAAILRAQAVAEIVESFEVHSILISEWKQNFLESSTEVFGSAARQDSGAEI